MDHPIGFTLICLGLIGCAVAGFCFLMTPIWIANRRRVDNRELLTLMSLMVGWTLVGWIACFLWASFGEPEPPEITLMREAQRRRPRDRLADPGPAYVSARTLAKQRNERREPHFGR